MPGLDHGAIIQRHVDALAGFEQVVIEILGPREPDAATKHMQLAGRNSEWPGYFELSVHHQISRSLLTIIVGSAQCFQ